MLRSRLLYAWTWTRILYRLVTLLVCLIVSAPFAVGMAALSDEIALGVLRYTDGVQQEIEQLSRETERLRRSG